jgi:hypothetical protein
MVANYMADVNDYDNQYLVLACMVRVGRRRGGHEGGKLKNLSAIDGRPVNSSLFHGWPPL